MRYEAHFMSKLSDADGELNEPNTSLDFALEANTQHPNNTMSYPASAATSAPCSEK